MDQIKNNVRFLEMVGTRYIITVFDSQSQQSAHTQTVKASANVEVVKTHLVMSHYGKEMR